MATTVTMNRRLGLAALLLCSLVSALGCATPGARPSHAMEADGIFVRHLRFKVKAEHTPALEVMMKRLVEVARSATLPASYDWLCYREQADRYWLLVFADSASGFVIPPTLAGFVSYVSAAGGEAERAQAEAVLEMLEYEPEWEMVIRQKSKWSTVAEMSTATHPKARMIERNVRLGSDATFDDALAAWTTFLVSRGYALPVEGFAPVSGDRNAFLQVVFPTDWTTYHDHASFSAFRSTLDTSAQRQFDAVDAALMATVSSVGFYDGDYAGELSYASK